MLENSEPGVSPANGLSSRHAVSVQKVTFIGIGSILLGSLLLACTEAVTKVMTGSHPVGQVLVVRGLIVFVTLLAMRIAFRRRLDFRIVSLRWQLLRMTFAVIASVLFVWSLALLPLATAVALALTGPAFTVLLAARLLREPVRNRNWMAALIGFGGVLIILQPQPTGIVWALTIPVLAAISGALRDIVTRSMGTRESSWAMLWMATIGTVVVGCGDLAVSDWQPISRAQFGLFVLSAVLLATAHFFLIEGFRVAAASTVSPFKYTHLVWAAALGYLVWGDVPDPVVVTGSLLILLSGVLLTHDVAAEKAALR